LRTSPGNERSPLIWIKGDLFYACRSNVAGESGFGADLKLLAGPETLYIGNVVKPHQVIVGYPRILTGNGPEVVSLFYGIVFIIPLYGRG